MKSGMLWLRKDKKQSIGDTIKNAAARHTQKYGFAPTLAYVNPLDAQGEIKVEGIEVRTKKTVMPNHVWIGVPSE